MRDGQGHLKADEVVNALETHWLRMANSRNWLYIIAEVAKALGTSLALDDG